MWWFKKICQIFIKNFQASDKYWNLNPSPKLNISSETEPIRNKSNLLFKLSSNAGWLTIQNWTFIGSVVFCQNHWSEFVVFPIDLPPVQNPIDWTRNSFDKNLKNYKSSYRLWSNHRHGFEGIGKWIVFDFHSVSIKVPQTDSFAEICHSNQRQQSCSKLLWQPGSTCYQSRSRQNHTLHG